MLLELKRKLNDFRSQQINCIGLTLPRWCKTVISNPNYSQIISISPDGYRDD